VITAARVIVTAGRTPESTTRFDISRGEQSA
jgi:hypothetical protein